MTTKNCVGKKDTSLVVDQISLKEFLGDNGGILLFCFSLRWENVWNSNLANIAEENQFFECLKTSSCEELRKTTAIRSPESWECVLNNANCKWEKVREREKFS